MTISARELDAWADLLDVPHRASDETDAEFRIRILRSVRKKPRVCKLKIGRHEYDITEDDQFMDNKSCVQLLTQSKGSIDMGMRANPILSKRAIKELSVFTRVQHPHRYGNRVSVFSIHK